jgi:hypothetical protein
VKPGTRVEVRDRFDHRWTRGFEVAATVETDDGAGYRIKRLSDGSVLPVVFAAEEVRREKKRDFWWY